MYIVSKARPNCIKCKFFYITWEHPFGRGCHAFGFKTVEMPNKVVEKNSGTPCQLFDEKPSIQESLELKDKDKVEVHSK